MREEGLRMRLAGCIEAIRFEAINAFEGHLPANFIGSLSGYCLLHTSDHSGFLEEDTNPPSYPFYIGPSLL